jgi:hypothetical protein
VSAQPPTAEEIAAALPRRVTLEQLVLALTALGVPAELAGWVTEATLDPTRCEIEVVTNLRAATLRMSMHVDHRIGPPTAGADS